MPEENGNEAQMNKNSNFEFPPTYGPIDVTAGASIGAMASLIENGKIDESKELDAAAVRLVQMRDFVPSEYEDRIPQTKVRPLEEFSDMVVEQLGTIAELARTGVRSPMQVYALIEAKTLEISDNVIEELLQEPSKLRFHVARLDLAFAERVVAVAFEQADPVSGPATWRAIRAETKLFELATVFADLEGSHPLLAWSDIGSRHPILDVRSFLPPGRSRDQEVFMYRVQHAIDHGFRAVIIALLDEDNDDDTVEKALVVTEGVMRLMGHLSRVRDSGEFYKLDPYLSENGEVTGHGTGAFSVWVTLASYLLLGNEDFKGRMATGDNFTAFDSDAAELVRRVINGTLVPFSSKATMDPAAADKIGRFTIGFHAAHKAAVKRHAPTSMDVPAPASLEKTNEESMNAAIAS